MTATAHIVQINVGPDPRGRFVDILEVRDASGNLLDVVDVETAEDEQPYRDALAAAGYPDVELVNDVG